MKLTRRHFLATTALVLATPALADANGASDYVQQLGVEVLKLAKGGHRGDKALQKRFGALLNRYINIPSIANFALGPNKAKMPASDKAMFYDLVSNYAAALFVWYIDNFQGEELKVNSTSQQGPFTIVESRIDGNGEPINWRVLPAGGGYKVADINIRGVWLTIAMKDMFEKTLNASRGDFEPLYARLKEADTWN